MRRLEGLKLEMLATPDQQISLTDPDARSMAMSGRGSGVVGLEAYFERAHAVARQQQAKSSQQ